MVDVLGTNIPINTPSFDMGSSLGGSFWLIFILLFVVAIGLGIGIWIFTQKKIFNKKIIVFENIAGQGYQLAYKDTARLVKLGNGGEELLYLKKKKIYRTAYGKKMGKNIFWFAVGQDGYWYNIVLGDIDAKKGMLDIEPIDRDMRYMHVAIRKNIEDRYKKKDGFEKYIPYIINGALLIVLIIGGWFLLDKIGDISNSMTGAITSAEKVNEATRKIISSLENICVGSGLK